MPPFAPQMTPQVVPSPVANPRPITPETPDRDVDMDIDPPKYSAPPYPASSRHTERESRRSDNYDLPKGPRAPVPIEPEEPVHKPAPFLMPAPVPQYSHGRDGGRREPRARTPPPPPARARTPPVSANLPYRPERRSEDVDSMSGPSGRDDRETRNRTEAPKPSERSNRHEERRPAPPPVSLSVINGDRRRASSPSSTEAQPPEGGRHRHGRRAALSGSNVTPVASLRAWGKPKVQTEPSPVAQVVQPPPNPPPKQNGIKFDDRRDRERNERHERPSPLVREDSLPFESTPPPQPQRVEKKREPTPPIQERLPTRPDRSDADLVCVCVQSDEPWFTLFSVVS
ncbi:hypothetical protein SISNIDRAFT_247060 [Sistotremastrum niveocremeum HHB9708]|uniref:Uncharacterized protein n=1 Tax=Sistotremastrum niveocremeum HHB9708 TaxID=1314777 RepID=A0A164YRR3_9AGAM|nr:hypothetical protein SISNIDRAFT_247060 [Sistotremastrum niveocremeum HHB9708]